MINLEHPGRKHTAIILLLVAIYGLLHSALRLGASTNLGEHDAIFELMAQEIHFFYSNDFRPLYIWTLWLFESFVGKGIGSFLLIKYLSLILIAYFIYQTSFLLTSSRIISLLSVESLGLVYQVFWRFHESYADAIFFMVFSCGSIFYLQKYFITRKNTDAILFNLCAVFGFLSYPLYDLFFGALILATLFGKYLSLPKDYIRIVLPTALPISLIFLYTQYQFLYGDELTITSSYKDVISALWHPAWSLMPLIPFVLLFISKHQIKSSKFHQFYKKYVLLILLFLALYGLFYEGIQNIPTQNLLGFTLPLIPFLLSGVSNDNTKAQSVILKTAILIAIISVAARTANMYILDPFCNKCRWGIPYNALAEAIKLNGFNSGIIYGYDADTISNLITYFPSSRAYLLSKKIHYDGSGSEAILIISNNKKIIELKESAQESREMTDLITENVPWKHLWRQDGYRFSIWHYYLIGHSPYSNAASN